MDQKIIEVGGTVLIIIGVAIVLVSQSITSEGSHSKNVDILIVIDNPPVPVVEPNNRNLLNPTLTSNQDIPSIRVPTRSSRAYSGYGDDLSAKLLRDLDSDDDEIKMVRSFSQGMVDMVGV